MPQLPFVGGETRKAGQGMWERWVQAESHWSVWRVPPDADTSGRVYICDKLGVQKSWLSSASGTSERMVLLDRKWPDFPGVMVPHRHAREPAVDQFPANFPLSFQGITKGSHGTFGPQAFQEDPFYVPLALSHVSLSSSSSSPQSACLWFKSH